MIVSIREALPTEAGLIVKLRSDRRLRSMQYAPSRRETEEVLAQTIAYVQDLPGVPEFGYKLTTITANGKFAGHITRRYYLTEDETQVLQLGWNLIPELWGQGIMVRAVRILLDQQFVERPDLECIVSCFRSNTRCRRVIERLGFQPTRIKAYEVLSNFVKSMGRHRLLKFRLSNSGYQRQGGANSIDHAHLENEQF
jgi:RimJ/RimL family protein N-acetyltransferase